MKEGQEDKKAMRGSSISKILSFNSEDKYIQRYLLQKGWVVNHDFRAKYFHLKWVFKPNTEDYHDIKEGQFINHIKNSH